MVNNFWTDISKAGITEDTSPSEAKRFKLTNQFIILTILFTICYSSLFGYYGYHKAVAAEIFFILSYIILLFGSKEKHTKLARFLFLTFVNFQIYITCLIFGEASQIHLIYVPAATIPIVLYDFKQKNNIFLFATFTIILLFDLFKIDFSSVLSTTISDDATRYFRLTSCAIAIICEVTVVYSLVINSDEAEQKLEKTNVLLEDQFETIFNNSTDALFLVDQHSKFILKANDRAVELFEMEEQRDFLTHTSTDFYKYPLSEYELESVNEELFTRGIYEGEYIYLSNKGNEFWGAIAIRSFNMNDKDLLTVRISDISEKRKNQEFVKASLHEKEVLLAEIHHRVKNNLAVISGLLGLQASHIADENAKSLFEESRNRIHSMALIHEKLYQNETFANIQMGPYVSDLVSNIKASYNTTTAKIKVIVPSNNIALDIKYAVPCGLILNELISNCYKHAFVGREKGEINVTFRKDNNLFTISVSDDGVGYDVNKLLKESNTLGLTLINALTEQIDGTLTSKNENGVTYKLTFKV